MSSPRAEDSPAPGGSRGLPLIEALLIAAVLGGALVVSVAAVGKAREERRRRGWPPVTMSLANADVRETLAEIGRAGGARVALGERVRGSVTLNLRNAPWAEALRTVAGTYGYVVVGNTAGEIRVEDPEGILDGMVTRVYRLRRIRPPNAGPGAPTRFPAFEHLKAALGPSGRMEFDRYANAFVVTDLPEVHREIAGIVDSLDR